MSHGATLFCAAVAAPPAIRRAWRSRTRTSSQASQRSHNTQRCVKTGCGRSFICNTCSLHRLPCSPDCLPILPAVTAINMLLVFCSVVRTGALLGVDIQLGIRQRAVRLCGRYSMSCVSPLRTSDLTITVNLTLNPTSNPDAAVHRYRCVHGGLDAVVPAAGPHLRPRRRGVRALRRRQDRLLPGRSLLPAANMPSVGTRAVFSSCHSVGGLYSKHCTCMVWNRPTVMADTNSAVHTELVWIYGFHQSQSTYTSGRWRYAHYRSQARPKRNTKR